MNLDTMIRALVRDELRAAGLLPTAPPSPPVGVVARFAATLAPGEVVRAAELYRRFGAWLEGEGIGAESAPTAAAFGRYVVATGLVTRRRDPRGRCYTVRP